MSKKTKQIIDYSKLTLPDIIERETKRKAPFFELEPNEQKLVLGYIKEHGLDIKVFKKKWYDVLKGKFYSIELKLGEGFYVSIEEEEKEFDTFSELYEHVRGDIYKNSCFFGYSFSEAEIKRYNLKVDQLNKDALIKYDIHDFTFKSIRDFEGDIADSKALKAKEMEKWLNKCKQITTLEELESSYSRFIAKFDFWEAKRVFFSILTRKFKDQMKEVLVEFACDHEGYEGFGFEDVLLTYGKEAAMQVIENYNASSYRTTIKRLRVFKDQLAAYESGKLHAERDACFRDDYHLYYVRDRLLDAYHTVLCKIDYFVSFDEFAAYLEGDLCGADLSKAPISSDDISKYKTDDQTLLPLPQTYETYEVIKQYLDGKFVVKQRWLNGDVEVLSKEHTFRRFFNFVHFLKGDLSNADLLYCDGIENIGKIGGLNLTGVKVRSEIAEKLGLPLALVPKDRFKTKSFEATDKNEIETSENLLVEHPEDEDYSGKVSYISDIHLLHRFKAYKCRTGEDVYYALGTIAKTLSEQATGVNLIVGDTSSDFFVFKAFVTQLASRRGGDYFFTLGNHELWGYNAEGFPSIVEKYRAVLKETGRGRMHLVQNNLFYFDRGWKEVTEGELSEISAEKLRTMMRSASLILFGGMGFAGMNDKFNADAGIYRGALNREEEIAESAKFFTLYEKVVSALEGKNLIVLTHMSMKDWGGKDIEAKEGVVYVNGHNHRNYFQDDGRTRIYADNQVGYRGKRLGFKQVAIDFNFDWFTDYKDGIYEITPEDYVNFYRGIGEGISFNREYEKLFMIKREKTYMFLMSTPKGSMLILNGGAIKRAGDHPLEYFYENLANYAASVRLFLSDYDAFQKQVAKEVRLIGGSGIIHGSIVDIDFYDHLYLNPLDATMTPYFAYSMVDKYVYDNFPSLLKSHCPKLFENYQKLIGEHDKDNALITYDGNVTIATNREYVGSTEMYRISRILKGLQYTTKYNIVRLWNDAVVANASKENGRIIVSGIIDPLSLPKPINETKPKTRKPLVNKVVNKVEQIKNRDDKYKALISQTTDGKVVVENYRGSTEKADYKCTVCGHSWSTRPDHFKSRQKYSCPICSKRTSDK